MRLLGMSSLIFSRQMCHSKFAITSVVSAAINVQIRSFEFTCEPVFGAVARMSWASVNQVTGPSHYVEDLAQAAEGMVETIKSRVEQKRYLRNFFDKASSLVWAKLTTALVRSRPLLEKGAEQVSILFHVRTAEGCCLSLVHSIAIDRPPNNQIVIDEIAWRGPSVHGVSINSLSLLHSITDNR